MKKIFIAMMLFAVMALPMSVMAMTSMQDSDLSTVTGQSGVSIGADITMNLSFGTVAWGDLDGLATAADTTNHDQNTLAGGWVGIQNLAINNLRIHMRTDSGMVDTAVAWVLGTEMGLGAWTSQTEFNANLGFATMPTFLKANEAALLSVLATEQLLTIDVYTAGGTTGTDGKTYVRIGIPTFEITMNDLNLDVGLFTNTTAGTPGTYQSLGKVAIGGIDILLDKNNYVDISQNDTAQGVLIHVGHKAGAGNGNLAEITFGYASWGDCDGLNVGATPTLGAGYIGITGMTLGVAMDMTLNINIGTTNGAGVPGLLASLTTVTSLADLAAFKTTLLGNLAKNDPNLKDDVAYILHLMGTISATSVDIALAGTITVSTMATQVKLADNAPLAGTYTGVAGSRAGILGNIYVQGLTLSILGNAGSQGAGTAPQSWVSISAH